MARHTDPERIRHAQMTGRVAAVRAQIRVNKDPEREQRARAEWPELWEKIDALVELIDW